MRLLAASLSATAVSLGVGWMLGIIPVRGLRSRVGPKEDRRRQWLVQAGLDVTVRQFLAGSIGAGIVAGGLFYAVTGVWSVALPPALLVGVLPRLYYGRARERRLSQVQLAWPDGLRDVTASISSGMSLHRAVEQLARTGPAPLREAFRRFPFLARTMGVVPALEVVKEELADPTSDRVIEVLVLAHERGGAIVPQILGDLADATTRDAWTLEEIQTEALEQKINSRAVFVLPWLVLLAVTIQDGAFRDFYGSRAGVVVVGIGAALSAIGMLIAGRLGSEPAEPRVLGGAASSGRP